MQAWCRSQPDCDAGLVTDKQTLEYAAFLYRTESFPSSFRTLLNGLGDYRKQLISEGKCADSHKPTDLQPVKDFLKAKEQEHQQRLMTSNLAARDLRLMTMEHLAAALTNCLADPTWGMLIRAEMLMQVALAARNDDCRNPLYKHLALRRYTTLASGTPDLSNDAVGRDPAVALIWNCADGKGARNGTVENRSAVRYAEPQFCPVSAIADFVIKDLTVQGRLCKEVLRTSHILRCPSASGQQKMGATTLGEKLKATLKAAGVLCDLLVAAGGKTETTHALKKLSLFLHQMQDLSFQDQQLAAGHERNVTEQSYLYTTAARTMFCMAGHGQRFRTEHFLGRGTVPPSPALLALALPGLDELALELAADVELMSIGQVLLYLREVWLQDAVLKAKAEGAAYTQHFPHLAAIMQHEDWAGFATEVETRHLESTRSRHAASAAKDVAAVAVLQERLRQAEERNQHLEGRVEQLLVANTCLQQERKRVLLPRPARASPRQSRHGPMGCMMKLPSPLKPQRRPPRV